VEMADTHSRRVGDSS